MKKLLIIVVAICAISCESLAVKQGRIAYKKHFEDTLIDPGSLKIYEEVITYEGSGDAKFDVDFGAKNSYGAYVRETYSFHTIGAKVFTVNGKVWFD